MVARKWESLFIIRLISVQRARAERRRQGARGVRGPRALAEELGRIQSFSRINQFSVVGVRQGNFAPRGRGGGQRAVGRTAPSAQARGARTDGASGGRVGERSFLGFFVRTRIQSFTRHCAVASMGSEIEGRESTSEEERSIGATSEEVPSEEQRSEGASSEGAPAKAPAAKEAPCSLSSVK